MRKILLLLPLLLVLFACNYSANAQADKIKEVRKVTLEDDKEFTIAFLDTSLTVKLNFKVIYQSERDTYVVYVQRDGKNVDTFGMKDPLDYQFLKDRLNKLCQKILNVKNAVTDKSSNDVYLGIYYIRHVFDKAPASGTLMLAPQIMVIDNKKREEACGEYNTRMPFVQRLSSKYAGAKSAAENAVKEMDQVYDMFIGQVNTAIDDSIIASAKKFTNLSDSITNKIAASKRKELDIQEHLDSIKKIDAAVKKYSDSVKNDTNNTYTASVPSIASQYTKSYAQFSQLGAQIDAASKNDKYKDLKEDLKALKELIDAFIKQRASDSIKIDTALKKLNTAKDNIAAAKQYKDKYHSLLKLDNSVKKLFPDILVHNLDSMQQDIKVAGDTAENIMKRWKNASIYTVDKVSMQFERGFLERIQVSITVNDVPLIFENMYAIGFSSINNYKAFKLIRLFARNADVKSAYPYIYLSDVIINYDNVLENYTRDYCPGDTAFEVDPVKSHTVPVTKERLVNLFDAKLYTDLKGLAEKSPNGLVQIDVSKRFNLRTIRSQIGSSRKDWGWLNYMNIWGALTKIEKKENHLPLRNNGTVENGVLVSPYYATNLDIRRYELGSMGFDLNALLYDNPDDKITLYMDIGARYGLTKLLDTVLTVRNGVAVKASDAPIELDANTITIFPRISAEIFAQKRVGLILAYQFNYTYQLSNNKYKAVVSYDKSNTDALPIEPNSRKSHMIEMLIRAGASDNENNKFFLRTRLFFQPGDLNTMFPQIQLGYNYNLFYKK